MFVRLFTLLTHTTTALCSVTLGSDCNGDTCPAQEENMSQPQKFPVVFVSHGGGPCFFMEEPEGSPFKAMDKNSKAAKNVRDITKALPGKPKAVLMVSAHWEASGSGVQVMSINGTNKMYYDYYGFPDEAYKVQYPAKGDPTLAARAQQLLKAANIDCELDTTRGLDHGAFNPLYALYPQADIPVVQLSLNRALDPSFHFRLGEAIAPLANEGVLIVGSGEATHNLGIGFGSTKVPSWAQAWQDWLDDTLVGGRSVEDRRELLQKWTAAPNARKAHPREEHLIPVMVCAGAAGFRQATKLFGGWAAGHLSLASYLWH